METEHGLSEAITGDESAAREAIAQVNRERMPETAKIVAEFRRVFGPVKVKWAYENGIEVGKRGPVGTPLSVYTTKEAE